MNDLRLSDAIVRRLEPPVRSNRITYEHGKGAVRGFGVRVTARGARSFILNYTVAGRERRYTIGGYPAWSVVAARDEARRLRQEIDRGVDPLADRETEREAPTVNELADRYIAEHAVKKRSGKDDEAMLRRIVRPEFGNRKVASITFADVDRLHRKLSAKTPYQANRLAALLSKMFSLAVRWQMRPDNPVKGVERNHEERRYRYLNGDELRRLSEALAVLPSQNVANVVRLLLLTGARRGEVLNATWDQFDLKTGIWTKPSSHTKQKREHRAPLSAPALQLLVDIKTAQERGRKPLHYVFPSPIGDEPLGDPKKSWAVLCKAADLDGVRLHDLRHTYAALLASAGQSLPVIGSLLGHTQPGTTARYAHLLDDPLRAATERAGALIAAAAGTSPSAEIRALPKGRAH